MGDPQCMTLKKQIEMLGEEEAAVVNADAPLAPELDPVAGIPSEVPQNNYFPDQIVRCIVANGGVRVAASRLDHEDSGAEALRLLASLATLQECRAEILGIAGAKILELTESPLPMIKRQAARLLHNLQ